MIRSEATGYGQHWSPFFDFRQKVRYKWSTTVDHIPDLRFQRGTDNQKKTSPITVQHRTAKERKDSSENRLYRPRRPQDSAYYQCVEGHFVNYYKDHGFVIGVDEATELLGSGIVGQKMKEYVFANDVHSSLLALRVPFDLFRKQEFEYVGSAQDGLTITRKEEE